MASPAPDQHTAQSPSSRCPRRITGWVSVFALVLATAFLFVHLGHYALWDDEANTALIGEGVWQTGDTSAVVGNNLVAYRGGVELWHLKERYLPPLQYYVAAPFVGLWPGSAWAARFPFASFGFLSILLIFWWLYREKIRPLPLLLIAMAFLGNVSFWLYLRQCRYYSLSIFFSLVIAYLYLTARPRPALQPDSQHKSRPWPFALIALLSIGLLASNYLNYAALYGALAIDWLIWSRRRFHVSRQDALWLVVPQILVGSFIVYTWNPLDKNVFGDSAPNLMDRIRLFWWAWRDLNRCEFAPLVLVVAAPIVAFWSRDRWLLRACVALLCYVLMIVILTPQNPSLPMNPILQSTRIFDVRYLTPAIPLMIAVGVLTILRLFPGPDWWPALLLGSLAFGTNVLHGGFLVQSNARDNFVPIAHSTPMLYIEELLHPPADPYTLAARWINSNVSPGQTVWVLPEHMVYPLMFHAPRAIYAWQLPRNPPDDLRGLNPVMYQGVIVPDYLVCFGPDASRIVRAPDFPSPTLVRRVATISFYGHDVYRPELPWRAFAAVTNFQPQTEGINIFRLLAPNQSK